MGGNGAAKAGTSRLAAGTGNGCPRTASRPRTWFCAWQSWHAVGRRVGHLDGVLAGDEAHPAAAGDVPDRHAAAVLDAGVTGMAVLQSGCETRSATWALSRATNVAARRRWRC